MTTATRRGRGAPKGLQNKTLLKIGAICEIATRIQPCNVRALAYQMFNRKLIDSMSDNNVDNVGQWCKKAREHGFLSWDWIVDETRQEECVATWEDPEAYAETVQKAYRRNKWQDQPTHLMVWCEKSTVAGTLRPVLRKYEVPFQLTHGYSGATPVWDAARANLGRKQKTLILYVGDYDPSGMGMSEVDLPRRLWRYSTNSPAENEDIDPAFARMDLRESIGLEIRRIALVKADTIALGAATSFPASDKKKDSRYPWFVENYGHWCWELDALDPNVLRDRVEEAILDELDIEIWNRYVDVEEREREFFIDHCRTWKNISRPAGE
jgi:hypothetical protein